MRVFIDTNVFISYLLARETRSPIRSIVEAVFLQQFTLLASADLFREILEVIKNRKRLAQRIAIQDAVTLISALMDVAELLPRIAEEIPAVTRDPKDDYLLAYALVGQADYLIIGDNDLLSIGEVGGLKIVSPATFVGVLKGRARR